MATFLELPREIYLIICSLLSTADLITLASLSRNHYLAAQRPLYSNVRLGHYGALIKLIGALNKVPIVSHISPRQRLYWHKLTDAQRSERQVEHLNLTLDLRKDGEKVTGAVLAHCLNAIRRKCSDARISLTLVGMTAKLIAELSTIELPGVFELTVFLSRSDQHSLETTPMDRPLTRDLVTSHALQRGAIIGDIWTIVFSGASFPDLRKVYINSLVKSASQMPSNLMDSFRLGSRQDLIRRERTSNHRSSTQLSVDGSWDYPFCMREIKIELNGLLNDTILGSLFGTNVNLSQITKLEIVNCPLLHPVIDIQAIAKFLRHALQQVRFLKLHLIHHHDGHHGYKIAYTSKITGNPGHHLCHIVREFGQEIRGLDLAVPFACRHMFLPRQSTITTRDSESLTIPNIPSLPACTLPDRLMLAGYQYRRLIFNDCCSEADQWDEMTSLAGQQGDRISWELVYNSGESTTSNGIWSMPGFLPVQLDVDEVIHRPFNE